MDVGKVREQDAEALPINPSVPINFVTKKSPRERAFYMEVKRCHNLFFPGCAAAYWVVGAGAGAGA